MRLTRAWLIVIVGWLLQAGVARAQAEDPVALGEARRHFQRGSALHKLGDHEAALQEFRTAYSLSQAPGLLFNMGQASRAARHWDFATFYFRAYLRLVPAAPERAYVEEQLAQMAPLVAALPPRAPVPPAADAAPAA